MSFVTHNGGSLFGQPETTEPISATPPHCDTDSWFAVQVRPQHEMTVAAILKHKGYQQFVPTYVSRRKWVDRVKLIERPLFAGYVFCRTTEISMGLVVATPGVVRIVGFNRKPTRIPEEEILAIHRVIQSGMKIYPCELRLRVGQKVQVSSGPLAGIAGTLIQVKNRKRLVISVDVTMKAVSLDIDAFEIRELHTA